MGIILKAQADLIDDKMKFECTAGEGHKIVSDYTPPLGCGEGPTSLELFLSSFCSCLGGTLAVLLRHQGNTVDAISVRAQAERRKEHPTCFESIEFFCNVKTPDASREEVLKVIALAEKSVCPVAAMVKGNVELKFNLEMRS